MKFLVTIIENFLLTDIRSICSCVDRVMLFCYEHFTLDMHYFLIFETKNQILHQVNKSISVQHMSR